MGNGDFSEYMRYGEHTGKLQKLARQLVIYAMDFDCCFNFNVFAIY